MVFLCLSLISTSLDMEKRRAGRVPAALRDVEHAELSQPQSPGCFLAPAPRSLGFVSFFLCFSLLLDTTTLEHVGLAQKTSGDSLPSSWSRSEGARARPRDPSLTGRPRRGFQTAVLQNRCVSPRRLLFVNLGSVSHPSPLFFPPPVTPLAVAMAG